MAEFQAHNRIERDPSVMVEKPIVKGTRITVEHILRDLSSGMSVAEIVDAYPRLVAEDVGAAVAYAADCLACEGLVSV